MIYDSCESVAMFHVQAGYCSGGLCDMTGWLRPRVQSKCRQRQLPAYKERGYRPTGVISLAMNGCPGDGCLCIPTHTHPYTYPYHLHTFKHAHTPIYSILHTSSHIYIYKPAHTHLHAPLHTYKHTPTHTSITHLYTHINTPTYFYTPYTAYTYPLNFA